MEAKMPAMNIVDRRGVPIPEHMLAGDMVATSDINRILLDARRTTHFTDKLHKHGFWSNEGMEKGQRKMNISRVREERRSKSNQRIQNVFDRQTKEVEKLQRMLAERQVKMAITGLHRYSALRIQTAYRAHLARHALKFLKFTRLIVCWSRFRINMKKRKAAAAIILRKIRNFLTRGMVMERIKMIVAIKKVQLNLKRIYYARVMKRKVAIKVKCRKLLKNAFLFGLSRANMKIMQSRGNYKAESAILKMIRRFLRRKRLKMLRGPNGKVAYHFLTYTVLEKYALQVSDVMPFVLRKVQEAKNRQMGKPGSAGSAGGGSSLSRSTQYQQGQPQRPTIRPKPSFMRPGASNNKKKSNTSTLIATDVREAQLPREFQGAYRPRSIFDIIDFVRDLSLVAVEDPTLVDGRVPHQLIITEEDDIAAKNEKFAANKGRRRSSAILHDKGTVGIGRKSSINRTSGGSTAAVGPMSNSLTEALQASAEAEKEEMQRILMERLRSASVELTAPTKGRRSLNTSNITAASLSSGNVIDGGGLNGNAINTNLTGDVTGGGAVKVTGALPLIIPPLSRPGYSTGLLHMATTFEENEENGGEDSETSSSGSDSEESYRHQQSKDGGRSNRGGGSGGRGGRYQHKQRSAVKPVSPKGSKSSSTSSQSFRGASRRKVDP